jgi:hypothetical protein
VVEAVLEKPKLVSTVVREEAVVIIVTLLGQEMYLQ